MNVNILGISELNGPEWVNIIQLTIISTTMGKNPLEENGHKRPKCSIWVQSQKWQNDLCSFPRQTIQYHSNPSLCPNHYAKETEGERFYEDLQDLLETTPKKMSF